jgi:hypothetical protein
LFAALALLAAIACAHERPAREEPAGKAPADAAEDVTPTASESSAPSITAGKVERLEAHRRSGTSEAPDDAANGEAEEAEPEKTDDDLIRIEAQSSGTPGLVLVRAMDGAQALGYTVLSLRDRDLYFVAEKRPSFLGRAIGTQSGICKIAVGTQKSAEDDSTRVFLKGRAQTSSARPRCRKDLEAILRYARGEVFRKPRLPAEERKQRRFTPHAR